MASTKSKWTTAQRGRLHHFQTTDPKDPAGAHALPSLADAWTHLRSIAATGALRATPAHAQAITRLQTEFAADAPPDFDPDFEMYRVALVAGLSASSRAMEEFAEWGPERALMSLLARGPIARVLAVLTSQSPFWIDTGSIWSDGVETRTLEFSEEAPREFAEPPPTFGVSNTFAVVPTGLWSALRMHVDALAPAAFDPANAEAHAFRRAHADPAVRAAVALAFARDRSHAREELSHPLNESPDPIAIALTLLLASATLADAKSAVAVLEDTQTDGAALTPYAYDLVESFGTDAAGLLEGAIRRLEARKMNAGLKRSLLGPLKGALKLVS